MDCTSARSALSARADGEASAAELADLDGHLLGCPDCRAHQDRIHELRRSLVLRQSLPPVDLADRVLASVAGSASGAAEWIRYALGVVAASLVVLNLPLLLGLGAGDVDHEVRHLGTFGVALGIGLLWAAFQPARATGLLPLAGALGVVTLVAALVDLGAGRTAAVTEASHLMELIGIGLLWMLAGGPQRLRSRAGEARLRARAL